MPTSPKRRGLLAREIERQKYCPVCKQQWRIVGKPKPRPALDAKAWERVWATGYDTEAFSHVPMMAMMRKSLRDKIRRAVTRELRRKV
jgi:hypothetical protein